MPTPIEIRAPFPFDHTSSSEINRYIASKGYTLISRDKYALGSPDGRIVFWVADDEKDIDADALRLDYDRIISSGKVRVGSELTSTVGAMQTAKLSAYTIDPNEAVLIKKIQDKQYKKTPLWMKIGVIYSTALSTILAAWVFRDNLLELINQFKLMF